MPTQNISMTKELASYVTELVSKGDYSSVSEVYREALRRFREQEETKKLQQRRLEQALDKGLEDSKAGRIHPIDSATDHDAFYQNIESSILAELPDA